MRYKITISFKNPEGVALEISVRMAGDRDSCIAKAGSLVSQYVLDSRFQVDGVVAVEEIR